MRFEARAADLHAPSCILEGLSPVSCGHASFKVHGRDAFGNMCALHLEDVTIHVKPEAALPRVELQQGEHCVAVALSDLSQSESIQQAASTHHVVALLACQRGDKSFSLSKV